MKKEKEQDTSQTAVNILSDVVYTFPVSATTENFVVKDKFKIDTSKKAKVKISYLGEGFRERLLKKIEKPFPGSTLCGRQLNKKSVDGPILTELGESEKAETTLVEVYAMLEKWAEGKGALLCNGRANIFYIRDINDILCSVDIVWRGIGYSVDACSVDRLDALYAGQRIFSRN